MVCRTRFFLLFELPLTERRKGRGYCRGDVGLELLHLKRHGRDRVLCAITFAVPWLHRETLQIQLAVVLLRADAGSSFESSSLFL